MSLGLVDRITDYERGELDDRGVLALFSELIQSGLCWKLQGHYGRQAKQFIELGWIRPDGTINLEALPF